MLDQIQNNLIQLKVAMKTFQTMNHLSNEERCNCRLVVFWQLILQKQCTMACRVKGWTMQKSGLQYTSDRDILKMTQYFQR